MSRAWARLRAGRTGGSTGLTCRELVELVTDYLEGALSPRDRDRFERHLAGCRDCRAHLAQMRRTLTTLGTIPEGSVPPHTRDVLLRAFRDWRS
ncbi:MAG: anti-sigma factor [Candidatus Velamenicoccus archaeovorus]